MDDEIERILEIRDRLQTRPDSDCHKELVETLEILSDLAAAVRDLQRDIERVKY